MKQIGQAMRCRSEQAEKLVQIGEPANSTYWKSLEERRNGPHFTAEFPGGLPQLNAAGAGETTRRGFLGMMGFSLAALGLSGCRGPVQNAIPLLVGSDDITPGVANYYATTCRGCASSCALAVKQRDGRPIKIEGNAESTLFGGGTCATGQATVLSLYDDARLRGPLWLGQPATWQEIDKRILDSLREARESKREIVLLSGSIVSPSMRNIIAKWRNSFPNFRHVEYDPISFSALRAANEQSFGRPVILHYAFDK